MNLINIVIGDCKTKNQWAHEHDWLSVGQVHTREFRLTQSMDLVLLTKETLEMMKHWVEFTKETLRVEVMQLSNLTTAEKSFKYPNYSRNLSTANYSVIAKAVDVRIKPAPNPARMVSVVFRRPTIHFLWCKWGIWFSTVKNCSAVSHEWVQQENLFTSFRMRKAEAKFMFTAIFRPSSLLKVVFSRVALFHLFLLTFQFKWLCQPLCPSAKALFVVSISSDSKLSGLICADDVLLLSEDPGKL